MAYRPYHAAFKDDPYYQLAYHKCYLEKGDTVFDFEHSEGKDFFCFRSIKRPIRKVGEEELRGEWFDLESVYGFGGYITNSDSEAFVKQSLARLEEQCRTENIIAHFMRFHPLNDFSDSFGHLLGFKAANRKVVFVDVENKEYADTRSRYSSSLKRNINKARRLGLAVRELPLNEKVRKDFMRLYYSTMERKEAADIYFFSEDYFKCLFTFEKLHAYGTFYQDELISMILTLDSGKGEQYYHLGATHADYYSYNPNPFILDQLVQKTLAEGGHFLFLGGGNSYEEEDPLYRFKKKFSGESQEFYIGGSIFNEDKFMELKALAADLKPELPPLFLSYRFV